MTPVGAACFRGGADGIDIFVRVTPKASRDAVEGVRKDDAGRERLVVKVRAAPEDGAANRAATDAVAHWLDLPRSAVTLAAGSTSRSKTLRVDCSLDAMVAAVDGLRHAR